MGSVPWDELRPALFLLGAAGLAVPLSLRVTLSVECGSTPVGTERALAWGLVATGLVSVDTPRGVHYPSGVPGSAWLCVLSASFPVSLSQHTCPLFCVAPEPCFPANCEPDILFST